MFKEMVEFLMYCDTDVQEYDITIALDYSFDKAFDEIDDTHVGFIELLGINVVSISEGGCGIKWRRKKPESTRSAPYIN